MATVANSYRLTLSLATLVAIADHVVRYGYVDLPPLTAEDIIVLQLLVQAAELRLA